MKNENLDTQITERKIYKEKALWFGSLIGGPLIAGYIIAENFKAFNEPRNAQKTWLLTIVSTIIIFAGALLISDSTKIPNQIIPFTYTIVAYFLLKHYQGTEIESHIESGGQVYKWGRVIIISLIGLAITLVGLLGILLISDSINNMNVNTQVYGSMKHEITYDNNISEEEIDNLANAFIKTTFFDDAVTKYVYVGKITDNYEISIGCDQSVVDDPTAIEPFIQLKNEMQALYPNNKLVFNLVVDDFDNVVKRLE